jgi:hypothetical protein
MMAFGRGWAGRLEGSDIVGSGQNGIGSGVGVGFLLVVIVRGSVHSGSVLSGGVACGSVLSVVTVGNVCSVGRGHQFSLEYFAKVLLPETRDWQGSA